MNPQRYL
jgi:hypothetical protein